MLHDLPRIEKRLSQFKSVHNAAPLLFKKVHRVEANLFRNDQPHYL
jgi:hypothetical protein